jgi:hypothetical protein
VSGSVQLDRASPGGAAAGQLEGRTSERTGSKRAVSWALSVTVVVTVSMLFCLFVPALWHWMILPTSAAGILIGVDAVEWARRRLDVLQPSAVVALFGFHLFYVGPLLHVALDYWPRYVEPAQDWRTSLGILAVVNTVGIIFYRIVISIKGPVLGGAPQLNERRFATLINVGVSVSLLALVGVFARFGGPMAYLAVVSGSREELAGNGWLLLIAESWPMLLFAFLLVARRDWFRTHLLFLLALFITFIFVQFVTSGLRGSRGNTVWPAMMAIGLVHMLIHPVRRRMIVAATLALVAFMYIYGFYKSVGTSVLGLAEQQTTTTALADKTGRTFSLLLLEDFGRAGTQSIVIDRLEHGGDLAWGMTYVGDLVKLTPDSLVPDPPADKSSAGTDLLYGAGAYDGGRRSSRIFGLVGEGMLNFGLVGGALIFLPFAVFVRKVDRVWRTAVATESLSLKLIAPSLTAVAVVALGSDFDNVLWLLCAQVLPLAAVVYLAGRSNQSRSLPSR